MNINEFKGRLRGGVRSNLFEVVFTYPDSISLLPQFGQRDSVLIKASQLPGATLGNIDVPFMGRQIKIAGDRTFQEWTITVLNDEDFQIRSSLETWMNAINSHQGNIGEVVAPEDYYGTANVIQLDRNGVALQEYVLRDIYPSELSPVELAFDTNDVLQEFQVTIQVNWWDTVGNAGFTTPNISLF